LSKNPGARQVDVIVNADDFGMSPEVNEATFALISRQIVTSATIMVNAPAFEPAVAKINRYPKCSFGIHLNVTEFHPLTTHAAFKDFLDENGNFRRENLFIPIGPPLVHAIFCEWCAQIEKALSHGIKISHIDSHDHIHARKPQLFPCLKLIQKKYKISKVRIAKNIYSPRDPIRSKTLHYKKKVFNYAIKKFYPTITTVGFTDFTSFLEAAKHEMISHDLIELMVHPGNPEQLFIDEIALLLNPWVDELPFKINLISYNDL
jgi:predicted glycoside hydrolase/deacetylase ChbG (UPF0249 family)